MRGLTASPSCCTPECYNFVRFFSQTAYVLVRHTQGTRQLFNHATAVALHSISCRLNRAMQWTAFLPRNRKFRKNTDRVTRFLCLSLCFVVQNYLQTAYVLSLYCITWAYDLPKSIPRSVTPKTPCLQFFSHTVTPILFPAVNLVCEKLTKAVAISLLYEMCFNYHKTPFVELFAGI
jgi:hypothetical protein